MDRVARRGPLARAPGALKGGHFRNIFVSVEGGPFVEKTNFRKKVSQCRKTERGDPLGFLNTQCVVKSKKLKGTLWREKIFRKKSHNAEKLKGGPFGIFQHPFCRKTAKKMKGDPLGEKFSEKKSRSAKKN